MNLVLLCAVIAVVVMVIVLTPFFYGPGGKLAPGASISDIQQLEKIRQQIIERFVEEEKAFGDGQLAESTWKKRQEFLENRYIDVCRRIDFIGKVEGQS